MGVEPSAPGPSPTSRKAARVNPYAGGGGGTTFAHKVAVVYLTKMLLNEGRPETRDQPIVEVAFQTDPEHQVDDLHVVAGSGEDVVRLSVAIRCEPAFRAGHEQTVKLVGDLLTEVRRFGSGERSRVVVAVAQFRPQYEQVQELASLAALNKDAQSFYAQVETPERFSADIWTRLGRLKDMVRANREADARDDQIDQDTWALLARLDVVPFRVEAADLSDWSAAANSLNAVARAG